MDAQPKNFALIGSCGYIAPRHLQAIKETGHRLIAALDRSDSAGILDRFFPETRFFTEFERFDRHAEKLRRLEPDQRIDMVSICSPNYLHDAHIRFALRIGADALCEKPLVLNPWNLDALADMERESGRRVWTVLQLRLHPALAGLKNKIASEKKGEKHDVNLTYITGRGNWYHVSWKGDVSKSGGVGTNIGIHLFDLLIWIFGPARDSEVHLSRPEKMAGFLDLERARVRWFLSVARSDLPAAAQAGGRFTHRSLLMDGEEIEFSAGFSDLHTEVYRETMAGRGCGIEDARASIVLAHNIRTAPVVGLKGEYHPMCKRT